MIYLNPTNPWLAELAARGIALEPRQISSDPFRSEISPDARAARSGQVLQASPARSSPYGEEPRAQVQNSAGWRQGALRHGDNRS